jgi:LmbE family N-acetylglucosaminyl deacetylase
LTDGEPTPRCPDPRVRKQEARAAADVLGAPVRVILDLPNRRLFDSFEARVALAKQFRKYRPRVVIGFGDKTPTASPDHWQAMQITDAAVFYCRLTKWDEHFDHLPPHTIASQLYFAVPLAPVTTVLGASHFVMDISESLEQKIEAIRCYATQFPLEKAYVIERVRGAALHTGSSAGFLAGELFICTRTLGTTDLMRTVFGT